MDRHSSFLFFHAYLASTFSFDLIVDYSDTKVFVFDKFFRECPGYNNLTFKIAMGSVHRSKSILTYDFQLRIEHDFKDPLIYLEFQRCASKESLDTFSVRSKMKSTLMCKMLQAENDAWSKILECIQPRLKCPLLKNVHEARSCSLDMSKFRFFPLSTNDYWKLEMTYFDKATRKVVGCYNLEGKLTFKNSKSAGGKVRKC